MCRFEEVHNDGIKVFRCGIEQYCEFVSHRGNGHVGIWERQSIEYKVRCGDYVVLAVVYWPGAKAHKPWAVYLSEDFNECLQYVRGNDSLLEIGYIYEIWHIVDDADLYQVWDMEADAAAGDVLAAEAMESVFGVDKYIQAPKCVVCKDAEYGPWVTVKLPEGTRYMCEDCFDAINTARFATGHMPLRIARCYS